MANYSDIKGFTIQTLSTDTIANQAAGGAWASGGSLNNGLVGNAGFGTYTAAVSAGGTKSPGITNVVEHYDGSSWTNATAIPAATDSIGSCGTQTAGLVFGGQRPPNTNATFEYNGSSWTAGGNLNTTRRDLIGAGTQTAGLAACGAIDPPFSAEAEQYNGSSWTTVAEANTAARSRAGGGTSTSAMAYGGYTGSPAYTANAETWNGSAWTEVSNLSDLKGILGGGGASNTDQLAFGGYGGSPESARFATTESWDGTSWTEVADLSVARSTKHSLPSAPTANQLYAGGHTPPANYTTITEEWSAPSTFTKQIEGQLFFNSTANAFKETITDLPGATWASGGSLNTGRDNVQLGVGGTQTAAIVAGGEYPNATANVERYDGTSWTEVNNLNTARMGGGIVGGVNAYTAGLLAGGFSHSPNINHTQTETWDGTSWTEVNDINTGRSSCVGAGSSSAALLVGGAISPYGWVELWNGSSWTETTDTNSDRYGAAGSGISTDMIYFGGSPEPAGVVLNESWNGSSWSETTDLNTAVIYGGSSGTQTSALSFGGQTSTGVISLTEAWDGTSWTELSDMGTARNTIGGAGASNSSGLAFGGTSTSALTEEFTASLANKTITAS